MNLAGFDIITKINAPSKQEDELVLTRKASMRDGDGLYHVRLEVHQKHLLMSAHSHNKKHPMNGVSIHAGYENLEMLLHAVEFPSKGRSHKGILWGASSEVFRSWSTRQSQYYYLILKDDDAKCAMLFERYHLGHMLNLLKNLPEKLPVVMDDFKEPR